MAFKLHPNKGAWKKIMGTGDNALTLWIRQVTEAQGLDTGNNDSACKDS